MRDIIGYEGSYAVTSCGKVWSYKTKCFLEPNIVSSGYHQVTLYKDGKAKNHYVHRLVAAAYIPNPDNLETIDHIDSVKSNNYVGNLQWMTRENNTRKGRSKRVFCEELGIEFESATKAAQFIQRAVNSVTQACRGEKRTCAGYHFHYVEA